MSCIGSGARMIGQVKQVRKSWKDSCARPVGKSWRDRTNNPQMNPLDTRNEEPSATESEMMKISDPQQRSHKLLKRCPHLLLQRH